MDRTRTGEKATPTSPFTSDSFKYSFTMKCTGLLRQASLCLQQSIYTGLCDLAVAWAVSWVEWSLKTSTQAWINTHRNRNRPRFRFHLWNGQTCRCVCSYFSVWMVSDKLIRLFLFKYLTATIKAFFQGPRTRPRDSRVVISYSRQTSNLLWLIGIEITSNPAHISLHHY